MELGEFKGQPWIVFDTVVSPNFLVGATVNAIGTNQPAIGSNGQITFLNAGRTRTRLPWYTNMDLDGQLAYGMRVWGIYIHFAFPVMAAQQDAQPLDGSDGGISYAAMLAHCIINFGVLRIELGQEQQTDWPVANFGAGGGLVGGGQWVSLVQNSVPQGANVQKLPEPIDVPRTQNISCKIVLAPEILPTIGTPAAPGFGTPLVPGGNVYTWQIPVTSPGVSQQLDLDWPPYAIQLGLIGERIKKTQYGQEPGEDAEG